MIRLPWIIVNFAVIAGVAVDGEPGANSADDSLAGAGTTPGAPSHRGAGGQLGTADALAALNQIATADSDAVIIDAANHAAERLEAARSKSARSPHNKNRGGTGPVAFSARIFIFPMHESLKRGNISLV
jgi:hypothetical protein